MSTNSWQLICNTPTARRGYMSIYEYLWVSYATEGRFSSNKLLFVETKDIRHTPAYVLHEDVIAVTSDICVNDIWWTFDAQLAHQGHCIMRLRPWLANRWPHCQPLLNVCAYWRNLHSASRKAVECLYKLAKQLDLCCSVLKNEEKL